MFNRLMNKTNFQIEYINNNFAGHDQAFCIYIRASKHDDEPYCLEAKHRLFLCFDYIHKFLDEKKLVAIYVDLVTNYQSENIAFEQMINDTMSGKFFKILTFDLHELMKECSLYDELNHLSEKLEVVEYFDLNGYLIQANAIPLNQLLGV